MAAQMRPYLSVVVVILLLRHVIVRGQWLIDYGDNNNADYDYGDEDLLNFDLEEEEEGVGRDKEEKPCAPPPPVRHGQTHVWGGGLLLEYACDLPYQAVGPTHGACDLGTGTWTIEPPFCVESKCPSLLAPNHGVVETDVTGGVATFTCRPGYYLIGSRVLLCEGGRWTGIYPICAVIPKPVSTTTSGDVARTTVTMATPVTEDLNVEDSDETCFHHHVEPPTLPKAVVDISYVMNEIRGRYVMVATYSCYPGYRLLNQSANTLFCRNLQWGAAHTPKCVSENNPCEINKGGCEHMCVPGNRTYACTCHPGYTLLTDGKHCVDVDECAIDNGGCQQECHNTHASFFCTCHQGYVANGPLACLDIDECQDKSPCPGECINTAGSYQCDCNTPGYRPSSVPTICEDVDECLEDNGGCADVCVNKRGSYLCRCEHRGRRLGPDRRSCQDIDECERYKNKVCQHGTCQNTDGSYLCTCDRGYVTDRDGSACADIDECADNSTVCSQLCTNTQGSYQCGCNHGYVLDLDNVTCLDVDECSANSSVCEDRCVNQPGDFTCICTELGHVLAPDNTSCIACTELEYYDDSTQSCRACPAHAHAVLNWVVALSLSDCECDVGFRGSPALMTNCTDIDECSEGLLNCSHTCINAPGHAHCTCPTGYVIDPTGMNCDDIDECSGEAEGGAENSTCSQLCVNLPGSYSCLCQEEGYSLAEDLHTCVDVDECGTESHNCSHDCTNTLGGFVCHCPIGFFLEDDDSTCQDINECFLDQSPCQQTCNNTDGSYQCGCYGEGFRLSRDLTTCVDINECMEGDNPCPDICINTVGSYTCDCNRQGYRLAEDSSACLDVNECDDPETHGCEQRCVNLPGSFRCDCQAGYRRFGAKGCQACPQGMYRPLSSQRCLRCPARSSTNGTAKGSLLDCFCQAGYVGNPEENVPCLDINECLLGNFGCQHRCINTVGSAYCTCNAGYRLSQDRKTCEDVDECTYGRGRCHQLCINTPGSYNCNCSAPYYTLNRNGYSCDDVNECESGALRCEERCVNTVGGAHCTCTRGFSLAPDNSTCQDTDECASNNGGCDDVCVNTVGSFECECAKKGFRLSNNKRQCVDINECLNKSLCEGRCDNLYGSYRCHCLLPGTQLSADGHSCEDADECQTGEHSCDQQCVNTDDGYECHCFPGYYRNESRCVECPRGTFRDESWPSDEGCQSCPENMTTDAPRSRTPTACICKEGYSIFPLVGRNCRDINECATNNGECEGGCQNSPGSFTCTCSPGYTLAEDNKTCTRTSCPTLAAPSHGRLVPVQCQLRPRKGQRSWLTPSTVCSYRCKRGYTLSGPAYRTCLRNATWNGHAPTCLPKTCGRLTPPDHAFLFPPICRNATVPFRKRCKFRCMKNFRRRGKSGARCLANQRWSTDGNSTRCVPKVKKPAPKKSSN